MHDKKGWILLVIVLVVVIAVGYAFTTQSPLGEDFTGSFYDYLSGNYDKLQPVK